MRSEVFIGKYKSISINSFKWSRSVTNFSDVATIKVPTTCTLRKDEIDYKNISTGLQFSEGMNVEIKAGYDDKKVLRFKGFIKRINFAIPLEIECEGYSYQLRKALNFSKSYRNTTVKKILQDLITNTDIKLSNQIPQIPIEKVTFQNVTKLQVLEWLKEKCLLTVYFNFDTLYVGGKLLEVKDTVRFRLGWNTVKDSELKFNDKKEFAEVRIQIENRQKDGKKKKHVDGKKDSQLKVLKTLISDSATLKAIAEQSKKNLVNRGYEGSITAFLDPYVEPGMAVQIEDVKYQERKGKYFVTGVEGEYSSSGGRQKINIGYTL